MSNFNIEFKLIQHTPIIHFQHDQVGATLRATELKPKLDKFLKARYSKKLPFGEKGNLDYQTKIMANHVESPANQFGDINNRYPLFFGNMGDVSEKHFTYTKDIIRIQFFSFNQKIRQAIEKNFAEFILKTNFGARQSKGFGSFYLDKSCNYYEKPHLNYKFSVNKTAIQDVFSTIELFYKSLRSGINTCDKKKESIFYFKSMMFLYAKSLGIQWDKKSIKESFFQENLANQSYNLPDSDCLRFSSNEKKIMKDLLGLSCSEKWKIPYKSTIEKKHPEIERFKSPIIFKPLKNDNHFYDVYFFTNKIDEKFLDQSFSISQNKRNSFKLKTPKTFDIDHFLNFVLDVDLNNHVESKFHKRNEFKELKRVYRDIELNLRGTK